MVQSSPCFPFLIKLIKSVCLPNVVGIVNKHALKHTESTFDMLKNPKVTIYYTDINLGGRCTGI
jgi:hypothetical protein